MRILYTTTIGMTMIFFRQLVKRLIDEGHTVDIATNVIAFPVDDYYKELGCKVFHIPWARSPFSKANIEAIKQVRRLAQNYDIVHCHTPVAAACTRIACKKLRKNGLKLIYTAHGFHFYKGAPFMNWIIFYPIEWSCSFLTDVLITINPEDYNRAKKRLHAKKTAYVPRVGVDIEHYSKTKIDIAKKRKELGVPENCFFLVSVGEVNKNKNHETVIRALAKINCADIHYGIAGEGELEDRLKELAAELNISDRVHLYGFRNDIAEIYKAADLNVFPSIREGLGLAALEGFAAGLPIICGDNRGTRSYARNGENALVCVNNSTEEYAENILRLYKDRELLNALRKETLPEAEKFSVDIITDRMIKILNDINDSGLEGQKGTDN